MKVWVSKYALSDGISERDVVGGVTEAGYVYLKGLWLGFKLGRDAHASITEAQAAAEKMRLKKIASLEMQIKKLQALKFDVPKA